GRTLYVNESVQRRIWRFDITKEGLANKRLFKQFLRGSLDGMRCDVEGNLYVTRYGTGKIAILSPAGDTLREFAVPGSRPSNLCFGGPDGKTLYITEVDCGRLLEVRVDKVGLAWQRFRESGLT
ncbi:MAG: SMP-30/gluconolactonase/LRE family protein, partial [Cyanobacteria bacterium]|nr:SMP-30/gluconolactonase/LRE family protein [Cyanobacteriota bacterium]